MPIEITPSPNTMIRIQMDYKPLKEIINIKEQRLEKTKREGFTMVEWGGSIIN